MKQISKCCKSDLVTVHRLGGTSYYECIKCGNPCDPYTPQSRCKTCGRFVKTEYFKGDIVTICKHCYKKFNVVDNEMMDKQFVYTESNELDTNQLHTIYKKYNKPKTMQPDPKSMQIYTEMVEWMCLNVDDYKITGKEYRTALLAKLKSLLGLT